MNLVAHADWSCHNDKRWWAKAVFNPQDGRYLAFAPERVEDPSSFLQSLWEENYPAGSILVGFDFPIGFPIEYARKTGVEYFLDILPCLGKGSWRNFFKVAQGAEQITLKRPFYPDKPGNTNQDQLRRRLDIFELRRACEKPTRQRKAACPLFWTLGAQQVGKAALDGWQKVLQNGLKNPSLPFKIWPFSGKLDELLQQGFLVVAETYPAEFYTQLGIKFHSGDCKTGGKRCQATRKCVAAHLPDWATGHGIALETKLEQDFRNGFGDSGNGEDPFDASVGLLGMLNILTGNQLPGEPVDQEIRQIEGWILGQEYTL